MTDPDTLDAVIVDIETVPTRPVPSRHDQLIQLLDLAAKLGVYVQLRSSMYPGGDLEVDVMRWVVEHRVRLDLTVEETIAVDDRGRARVVRVKRGGVAVADVRGPVVETTATASTRGASQ